MASQWDGAALFPLLARALDVRCGDLSLASRTKRVEAAGLGSGDLRGALSGAAR